MGAFLLSRIVVCCLIGGTAAACAQTIGSVATADAAVTTSVGQKVEIAGGRALLVGNPTVTAGPDRTATVTLNAGGEIRVCRTTAIHLSETNGPSPLLLLSLDRGALEIKRKAAAGDSLMTPDLRFTAAAGGDLDLRVRVVFNGDTCVENRGRRAPVLDVTDAFGEASYQLRPGQHVTFEGGSLRAMVDREDVPCGCPPDEKPGLSVADALVSGKPSSKSGTATNPFPAAQSEGLASPPAGEPEKPGETHMQIATTLSYDPAAPPAPATAPVVAQPAAPVAAPAQSGGGPLSAIGRFFKRLFVR
jgi:hypothetical protein